MPTCRTQYVVHMNESNQRSAEAVARRRLMFRLSHRQRIREIEGHERAMAHVLLNAAA